MRRTGKQFVDPGIDNRPVGIGFATQEIQPNEWGKFRKATGEKGSETPAGPELDGYFRTDPDDIALQNNDMVVWLDLPNGYDLNPMFCDRTEPEEE